MLIFSWRTGIMLAGFLIAAQAGILLLLGQPIICSCGYIKFWEGAVLSIGNSQHLADWYTFSHVIHGFIFYLLVWLLFPRVPVAQRFVMAFGVEVAWEIIENTAWIINHYREQALAVRYTGDSLINSISDTLVMALGFVMAWRLPVWSVVALAIVMELFVGFFIHDNLALNVLNFIHQFDFIRVWQNGTP